jgi:hypothetical protein
MARHKAHLWIGGLLMAPLAAAQLPPLKIILVGEAVPELRPYIQP